MVVPGASGEFYPYVYTSIETFLQKYVVFPKAQSMRSMIKNLDLKERVVEKDQKHIRAFASEMLLLAVGLGLWCEVFLAPTNLLPDECRSLQLG